jgi:hypothetical protein
MPMELLQADAVGRQLQSYYRLKVLTLSLDRSDGDPCVLFEVTTPDGSDPTVQAALLSCPSTAIGLPSILTEQNLPDSVFTLPPAIGTALASAVLNSEPAGAPLWVKFATPGGLLPIVPWERLIQPLIGVPILRLPYHALVPAAGTHSDCAVCFGEPQSAGCPPADDTMREFLQNLPPDLAVHKTIHLFAHVSAVEAMRRLAKEFEGRYDIRVHDPPTDLASSRSRRDASASASAAGATTTPIINPWLVWVRDTFREQKLDALHLLGHSYLSSDEGAVTLTSSPTSSETSGRGDGRQVWAPEIVECLNQTGAWSVAFSAPPDSGSLVGLRLLQDLIARTRPGPCLLHDMAQQGQARALGECLRFLFTTGSHMAPVSSSICVYCHPLHATENDAVDEASTRTLNAVTLATRVAHVLPGDARYAWLNSAQRVLEQAATTLSAEPAPKERATDVGRRSAMELVADSLIKYAHGVKSPRADTEKPAGAVRPAVVKDVHEE